MSASGNPTELKREICETGRLLFKLGLLDLTGGNLSVRQQNLVYSTPMGSGENFHWELDPESINVQTINGSMIEGREDLLSRDSDLHFALYERFDDVRAIIHCHPRNVLCFASLRLGFQLRTEIFRVAGPSQVLCAQIGRDRKEQIERVLEALEEGVPGCRLALIPHHGIVTCGSDLNTVAAYTQGCENAAFIALMMKLLGSAK